MTQANKATIDQIRDWIVPAVMMPLLIFFFYQMYNDQKGLIKDVQIIKQDGAAAKESSTYQIQQLNRIETVQAENVGRITALEQWRASHERRTLNRE